MAEANTPSRSRFIVRWLHWLIPVAGLLALAWFLIRVVPKPARAAYPCQRAAFPLASGFVLWLVGVGVALSAGLRARQLRRQRSWLRAEPLLAVAAAGVIVAIINTPTTPAVASLDPALDPLGAGRGIFPGRVVWVHDPTATDWAGTNNDGEDIGDGFWWEPTHTDQAVCDTMVSRVLRGLAGEPTDAAAWDAIFRHHNAERGRGAIGYQPGERITIKLNLVTTMKAFGNIDAEGNQTTRLGWVNTSPQMVLAMLRQLVNVAGVAEADITVGDPSAHFPNHYWDRCVAEFPDVNYLAWTDHNGRRGVVSSGGTASAARVHWSTAEADGMPPDYLPVSFAEATYLINLACLKGHSSGITLCAKNHYGSFIRLPSEAPFYNLHDSLPNPGWSPGVGKYRAHVDIIGHPDLGGKTVLFMVDGLYGGYYWEGRPRKWHLPPFGDGVTPDWPSSLFASLDPVAIDSVGYDFLLAEWPAVVTGGVYGMGKLAGGEQDYLHEAALAGNAPSGTFYDPAGDGSGLASQGVHEHWDDPLTKQYSRNLGADAGIELLAVDTLHDGDGDGDGRVTAADFGLFESWLAGPADGAPGPVNAAFDFDFSKASDLRDFAALQLAAEGE